MGQQNYPSTSTPQYPTTTLMPTNSSSVLLDGQLTLTNPYTTTINGTGTMVTLVATGNSATFNLGGTTYSVPANSQVTTQSNISGSTSVTITAPSTSTAPTSFVAKSIPTQGGALSWSSAAFGNNTFVLLNMGYPEAVYSTNNGASWTNVSVPNSTWNGNSTWGYFDVTYANGKFVAVGGYYAIYSTNGITWTQTTIGTQSSGWFSIAYGNGYYVAQGYNWIAYSTDAISWTQVNIPAYSPQGINPNSQIAFTNGYFMLAPSAQNGNYYRASNPATWTQIGTVPYWSAGGGLIAGGGGTWASLNFPSNSQTQAYGAYYSLVSRDPPLTGTSLPLSAYFNAMSYANGYFIASANNNNSPNAMISPDGITWTVIAGNYSGSTGINKVAYGNGVYIGGGGAAPSIALISSPNTSFKPLAFGIYNGPTAAY